MYPFIGPPSVTILDEEDVNSVETVCIEKAEPMAVVTPSWIEEKSTSSDYSDLIRLSDKIRGYQRVSRSLRPVLSLLRLFAYFPGRNSRRNRRKFTARNLLLYFLLINVSLLAILLNSYLSKTNIMLINIFKERFGLMHASTVSSIITGVKPMINVFSISLFLLKIKDHYRLLKTLDTVDLSFRSVFYASPPIHLYSIIFYTTVFTIFTVPCVFRIVEFDLTDQRFQWSLHPADILQNVSFILVPLLTVWNLIPLFYYDLYNRIVRYYCAVLIKAMHKEHKKRHFSLRFYYDQFLRITYVQEAVGQLFNPFILFSLAWSLMILCLTIYFITQPTSSLVEPITVDQITSQAMRDMLNKRVHFSMGWASLQVFVAALHIVVICSTGMQTNEITRQIVNAVLRIVPDVNADLDRFQISCFVHKMSTQFMWGMTVWRAFPLERTTFFTLVSVIITYSFLLIKLKDNPSISPIMRQIYIGGNVTIANSTRF